VIAYGNVKICEERNALLAAGAVIALTRSDHVVRFWSGSGPAVSFLAAECRADDGTRFMFGRLRHHADESAASFDGRDRKSVSQFACGAEIPEDTWKRAVDAYLAVARSIGPLRLLVEKAVGGDAVRFTEILQEQALADEGHSVAIRLLEVPPEDSE